MCECCQLAVVLEGKTAKLEQLVDFLVKIDEYDRIIDDIRLVSNAKGAITSGKVYKL